MMNIQSALVAKANTQVPAAAPAAAVVAPVRTAVVPRVAGSALGTTAVKQTLAPRVAGATTAVKPTPTVATKTGGARAAVKGKAAPKVTRKVAVSQDVHPNRAAGGGPRMPVFVYPAAFRGQIHADIPATDRPPYDISKDVLMGGGAERDGGCGACTPTRRGGAATWHSAAMEGGNDSDWNETAGGPKEVWGNTSRHIRANGPPRHNPANDILFGGSGEQAPSQVLRTTAPSYDRAPAPQYPSQPISPSDLERFQDYHRAAARRHLHLGGEESTSTDADTYLHGGSAANEERWDLQRSSAGALENALYGGAALHARPYESRMMDERYSRCAGPLARTGGDELAREGGSKSKTKSKSPKTKKSRAKSHSHSRSRSRSHSPSHSHSHSIGKLYARSSRSRSFIGPRRKSALSRVTSPSASLAKRLRSHQHHHHRHHHNPLLSPARGILASPLGAPILGATVTKIKAGSPSQFLFGGAETTKKGGAKKVVRTGGNFCHKLCKKRVGMHYGHCVRGCKARYHMGGTETPLTAGTRDSKGRFMKKKKHGGNEKTELVF
jgi:hypothetical protein